jgi:uncharacterized membrane protein YjjP (DUF1212 family)
MITWLYVSISFFVGVVIGWWMRSIIGRIALAVLVVALVAAGFYAYGAVSAARAIPQIPSWLRW